MNLNIIGTSHIAQQSINEIKKAMTVNQPELVALELDLERASALLSGEKSQLSFTAIPQLGVKGYLFAKIGQYAQQKLGQSVGIIPGSEMKTALQLAQKNNLEVAFIDQPIKTTLRNFSKTFTWTEKFHFLGEIFRGLLFPKQQLKKYELSNFDLRHVPEQELISKLIKQLKKEYPGIYKTLIDDRNRYMVKQLVKIMKTNPQKKILVIVGAGHKEGMEELLLKVDVVK